MNRAVLATHLPRCGWILALATISLLAPPASATQAPAPPTESKQDSTAERAATLAMAGAQEALEAEDYETATAILENFLLEHPGHAQALFTLAYAYARAGRTAEAIDMYRQTLEVAPDSVPARLNLGSLLFNADRPKEAAEQFEQALKSDPANYDAHLLLAATRQKLGEAEPALRHFLRAAELDPAQEEPRRAALVLLLEQKEWERAARLLDELTALAPDDPELQLNRAEILLQEGKKEEAFAALEKYLEWAAHNASAQPSVLGEIHMRTGWLARELGRPEEALKHFQAAGRAAGEAYRQASLVEQAETLADLGRYQDALPFYQQALAGAPDDVDLLASAGYAYLKTRNYQKAVPALARALELQPDRLETYDHLSSALFLAGNLPGAIEVLEVRASRTDETQATLFLRAIAYDKLEQCAAAIDFYEKFLARKPDRMSDQYFQATARLRLLKKTCRQRRR